MAIWKRLPKLDAKKEAALREEFNKESVTWKDKLAMVISAFLVLFIPTVLILLVFVVLILLLGALF